MNEIIIFSINILPFMYLSMFFLYNFFKFKKRIMFVEKYPNYMIFLDDIMGKAFELVYADKIRPYSMEGMKLDEPHYNLAVREFNTLVNSLFGPNIKNHLIDIYGNEETLTRHITLFFANKYENDKIRDTVTEDLVNNDDL
jgi:hypothetical protein